MTATALGLVLAAAPHAAWDLLAKRAGGAALVWPYGTASAAILVPLGIALPVLRRPDLGPTGLACTLAGAVLHVAYFLVPRATG